MRLHRHDEIVEAIANALCEEEVPSLYERELATAALDAMLEAVVKLGVAHEQEQLHGIPALVLRMEVRNDE